MQVYLHKNVLNGLDYTIFTHQTRCCLTCSRTLPKIFGRRRSKFNQQQQIYRQQMQVYLHKNVLNGLDYTIFTHQTRCCLTCSRTLPKIFGRRRSKFNQQQQIYRQQMQVYLHKNVLNGLDYTIFTHQTRCCLTCSRTLPKIFGRRRSKFNQQQQIYRQHVARAAPNPIQARLTFRKVFGRRRSKYNHRQ